MRMRVPRLRWSDPEPDDRHSPVAWRSAALITATLFLSFSFWQAYGLDLPWFGPLPVDAGVLGAAALLVTCLFFIGPAMAAQAARRPVFGLIENSLGSIPTVGLRLCCVVFLALWMANLVAVPALWALLREARRDLSSTEAGVAAAGLLAFLFFTGLQSMRVNARLALFTNKLGIAILVAAFIRVNDGWAGVPPGFPTSGHEPLVPHLWYGVSHLAFYVAPLGLLASDFGFRSPGRKQVALAGLTGVALPLFGALFFTAVIGMATLASRFYQPSLNPTVAMALWSHAAASAVGARMLVAAVTTFGAIRFGARALMDSASILRPPGRLSWVLPACLIAAIAWLSLRPFAPAIETASEIAATWLTVAGAVLTADFVSGRRVERVRRIDWVGVAALLAGLSVFCPPGRYLWGLDTWSRPRLLPAYGVGFLVCLLGRAVQKMSALVQTTSGHVS
jgi:hypothetical protein